MGRVCPCPPPAAWRPGRAAALRPSLRLFRLLSGNLHSDAYSLLRILYEVASLLHYAATSQANSREVHDTFFALSLPEDEHARGEWRLAQKAQREWEAEPYASQSPSRIFRVAAWTKGAGERSRVSGLVSGSCARIFSAQRGSTPFFARSAAAVASIWPTSLAGNLDGLAGPAGRGAQSPVWRRRR